MMRATRGRAVNKRRAASLRCRAAASVAAGWLFLWLVLPALAAPAAPPAPITLTADHIEYDTQSGVVVADGHVKASQADVTITADHLSGNLQTEQVEAQGHVVLQQGSHEATAEMLTYNYRTRVAQLGRVSTKYGPWNVTMRALNTQTSGHATADQASLTPCDPQHPFFHVTSEHVEVVPGDYFKAYNASLYIYGARLVTIPVYTASLRRGQVQSGPTVGYNNLDGLFVEYSQWFPLGDASDVLRVRYGTVTNITFENTLSDRTADHIWTFHLGRQQTYDQSGNLLNLDRNSLDLVYDWHRIAGAPVSYQVEGHYGQYNELATGVNTNRVDALFNLQSATFQLSRTLSFAASAYYQFDSYGTGQQRNITAFSAALTDLLSSRSNTTLSFNTASVTGIMPPGLPATTYPFTPFQFDGVSPDSSVSLSYAYYPYRGLLQYAQASLSYDFYSQQTTANAGVSVALSPTLLFTTSASYSLSTQQVTEVDYAVNATCDCLSVGVLYRTFPQSPQTNTLYVTLSLNPLAGAAATFQLGPTP